MSEDVDAAAVAADAEPAGVACEDAANAFGGASVIRPGADCPIHRVRYPDDRPRLLGACNSRRQ